MNLNHSSPTPLSPKTPRSPCKPSHRRKPENESSNFQQFPTCHNEPDSGFLFIEECLHCNTTGNRQNILCLDASLCLCVRVHICRSAFWQLQLLDQDPVVAEPGCIQKGPSVTSLSSGETGAKVRNIGS